MLRAKKSVLSDKIERHSYPTQGNNKNEELIYKYYNIKNVKFGKALN
jgi:hypothetical protein